MRLLILLTIISTWTYGQSRLTINNPAPRQGDEIDISITLTDNEEGVGKGNLKLTQELTETGLVTLGPFKFTIGDKTYETDILTVTVSPKIPNDIKDGLWIRLVDFNGEKYLIIEQRISNQWKREKKNDNEVTMTHGDGVKYAEFRKEVLEDNGLDILTSSSSTKSQLLDKNDTFGNGTVSYKIETFKFEKTDKFTKKLRIDKRSFDNFPDNIKVDEIWIE